ncbi:prefoldin subunit beta [Candidatus Woesearchaeota archaeon CG1_02_47_18]|nr:MAG: prefoldin subunit beta [Candidatus Woesearchaeota archaeon CG1_02_47_18]HII29836.1 prefoldin subunit beta [Candidatus Woesearchaeota archaeon]
MARETDEQLGQLQLMEQNMQNFVLQKQNFQMQLMEVESALNELKETDQAYKIIGNIMVKSSKEKLDDDLRSKKEMIELRVKTLEKHELKLRERASKLQGELLERMKKEGGAK